LTTVLVNFTQFFTSMEYDLDLEIARARKKEFAKIGEKLRKMSGKKVDDLFHSAHEHAFEEIDCLACANCCKTTSPIFRDVDIERLSKHLRISVADFQQRYLRMDEDRDWVLKKAPCPFLGDVNYCSVYEWRPKACREYPHTDRKNMSQLLKLSVKNTEICPAVSRIFQELSQRLGN
jgi:uncharacterized protein